MSLTGVAIKRPTFVVVIFSVLAVIGIFSYFQLKYELLPKITPPYISVITVYPGASPTVVETTTTKVIEDAISSIDQVSSIYGTSREGVSWVMIKFIQSADVDIAMQNTQRKIGEILAQLPSGAKSPVITKFALDELPILRIGATSNQSPVKFYQILKNDIRPRLSKVEGVGQITFVGGQEREIKVNIDRQKLQSYGLSLLQTAYAVRYANLDFPTGRIKDNDRQFVARVAGKFQSLNELRELVIGRSKQGGNIKLMDVAEIQDGIEDPDNLSRVNGVSSVGILVQKQTQANAVEVSKLVRDEIAKMEKDYTHYNLKFDIAADNSLFTIDAANAVKKDLLLAVLLVGLVMLVFLHSFRNSIIIMIAIPSSLVSTFIAMYAFGFSLNLMTLLAMSLVIGILVDDSIVVLENIYRHLEMGKDIRTAALVGRNEIGFTALSITMVDVVVFLPLSLVSGIVGNIVREFALVVVVSTLISLFVSFTITPMLASRYAKHEHLVRDTLMGRFGVIFEKQYTKLTEMYHKILQWSLGHPWSVIVLTFILIFASLSLIPMGFIGSEFVTQVDKGEFTVYLEMAPGTKLEQTNYITQMVEKQISDVPEVRKIFVNVGASSEGFIGWSSPNISELSVTLSSKKQRNRSTEEITREIKKMVNNIPGVKVRANPVGLLGVADFTPIMFNVRGSSLDEVSKGADIAEDVLRKTPGSADVRSDKELGNPETRIEIDRDKMASLGLTLGEVGETLRIALTGDDQSKYQEGSDEYTIRVAFDQFDRSRTSDVENIAFTNRTAQEILLKQFAHIYQSIGPTKLTRVNRNYAIAVHSQAIGRPSGTIAQDFEKALAASNFPKDLNISYEGDVEMREESFKSLTYALIAAILFVYLIMVALYNSYRYPFVVLFSIPVAIVGAILTLAMTMSSLNIFSFVGIIMLVGLVGKNAILLVDFANKYRAEGMEIIPALLEAGRTRLRPILMTTITMVIAMIPIAVSSSEGSEWKNSFAWALIGGLSSSLLLTLILVPVVYMKFAGKSRNQESQISMTEKKK